jgi:hypothetical protein
MARGCVGWNCIESTGVTQWDQAVVTDTEAELTVGVKKMSYINNNYR